MNSTFVNIFVSFAALLPGDPADCPDPTNVTDPSCAGGLASVASVIRHSQRRGDGPALYIQDLDRVSKFVQMHPEGWGVNRLIAHEHFGWPAYFTSPSLFSETGFRDVSLLKSHEFVPVMTNVDLPPSSKWSPYLRGVYFHEETGLAQLHIRDETQPLAAPAVASMKAALDYVAELNERAGCFGNAGEEHSTIFGHEEEHEESHSRWSHLTSQCWSAVVLFNEINKELYKACLDAALNHPHPPLVFYDMDENDEAYATPTIVNNGTVVFHLKDREDFVSHMRLEIGDYDSAGWRFIKGMEFATQELEDLPFELKDEAYVEDLTYLRTLADQALENDPIVGTSEAMPFTREGTWRRCMGGECPIGNLFTDAMRWAADADFAVTPSGGLRGPGWPAGPVRVSDLFTALPFMNYLCTGVVSGVSVFKLLNYSTSVATFESTYTTMGDRLLQMSGMRMTYNTLVEGSGKGRLMGVEIWDKEEGKYLPLERLKLYSFATDNWMCGGFDPYPSLFGEELKIDGEVPGSIDPTANIQSIVGEYLTELGKPYDTSIQQRLVNDTEAFTPLDFIQTAEGCEADYFWEGKLLTCKPCPGGKYVQFSDELVSFVATHDSKEMIDGRQLLYNRETFDVTIAPKHSPSWFLLRSSSNKSTKDASRSMVLQPGESVAIDFGIDSSRLTPGTVRSTVSWGVVIDGEYPGCLTDLGISFDVLVEVRDEENKNQIDRIRPAGLTFMALAMALSLFFAAWTAKNQNQRVLKAGQPHFLLLICGGTFIMASSIIPLSIDDSIASVEGCSKACMSFPWLFLLGFNITFSALTAKIWRLNKVMNNARSMSRRAVTESEVLAPILIFSVLNVVLLLCWTLVDPLKWNREPIDNDESNTYGFCASEGKASIFFITILILLNLTALVLACVQAWRARKMDDEFTESRWLGMAIASWIQVLVIGVPVILLTRSEPIASYFTQTALVFLVCVSMLLFIFVPKWRMMSKHTKPRESLSQIAINSRTSSLGRTVLTGMSSEPGAAKEMRYQQRIRELEALLEEAEGAKSLKESASSHFTNTTGELEVNGQRRDSQIAELHLSPEETIHRLSANRLKRMSSSGNLSV